jgi:glycine oxidase
VLDCVILGGGIIGCAIGWRLRARGLRVAIVERGAPVGEASSAAGGILAPQTEADAPGPFLDLALASRALWPAFAAELGEIGYRAHGTIALALDDEEEAHLRARAAWQRERGLAVGELSRREAIALEPQLATPRYALYFAGDHSVDARRASEAVARAAVASGVEIIRAEARRVIHDGRRVTGVELSTGTLPCARVVLACGSWSSQVAGALAPDAIEPVRGVVVELRGTR